MPAVLVVRDARPADYEHSTCLLLTLRRVSDTESNIKLGLFNASQAGIFPFDFPTIWVELLQGAECGLLGKPTRAASASTPTEEGLRLPAPLPPRDRRERPGTPTCCDVVDDVRPVRAVPSRGAAWRVPAAGVPGW